MIMFLLSPPPINFLSHLRLQLQQPRDLQHQILQKRCLSLPRLSIGFSWFQSVSVISELCLVRILPFFVAIDALFIRRPSGTVVFYLGTLRRLLLCQRSTSIHAWTPKFLSRLPHMFHLTKMTTCIPHQLLGVLISSLSFSLGCSAPFLFFGSLLS